MMSPLAFLVRPVRRSSRSGPTTGTLSGAPTFALRVVPANDHDAELAGLGPQPHGDGIERRRARCDRRSTGFVDASPLGIPPRFHRPGVRLAEVGVGLAVPPPGRGRTSNRRPPSVQSPTPPVVPALPQGPDDPPHRRLSGQLLPGYRFPSRRTSWVGSCPIGWEGQDRVRGPWATAGYFANPVGHSSLSSTWLAQRSATSATGPG